MDATTPMESLQRIDLPAILAALNSLTPLRISTHSDFGDGQLADDDALDLLTILQSGQSLGACRNLSELLEKLARIMLENSRAERLALLLPNQDKDWVIRLCASLKESRQVSLPLQGNLDLPVQFLQHVQRTEEVLVADGLKSDLPFGDQYLQGNPHRSLLCLPLIHQGKLGGLLYLEHSSTAGVFSQQRTTVVNFLCARAAEVLRICQLEKDFSEREGLQQQHNQVAATLEATNQRLHNVLKASEIGIWEWSYTDQKLTWDPQMFRIYGVEPSDFQGTYDDWVRRLHPDDFERMTAIRHEGIGTAHPHPEEFRIIRPDGSVRHVYANVFFEKSESGKTNRTVGINFDITERRQAELALQKAQSQLRRTTENVPGMIYRVIRRASGKYELTYVSSKCREFYGVEPEEALEDIKQLFAHIHPEDVRMIDEAMNASAETLARHKTVHRVKIPNRNLRWLQTIAQPMPTDRGGIAWDGVTIDITQRKQAEIQLQEANEKLGSATKMKDAFLANMSHELRTPLNAIMGMTEGLQSNIFGPVNQKQQEGFEVIQRSGAHLLELIDEVLDLAKIESGSMDLQLSSINVVELCESCIQLVRQQAAVKDIQISLNATFQLPDFNADQKRLRQVLVNLLSNAVKFTPQGGRVKIAAEVLDKQLEHGERTIRISVSDNGIGIEPSHLKTLFDPFVQVDSSLNRKYAGTGLGLALVKRFVELHSGSVSVTSVPGAGSCFSVTLPLRQPDGVVTPAPKPVRPVTIATGTLPSGSEQAVQVLLAEDNELVAKAAMSFLRASKFSVELATDGAAAIEVSRDRLPDVILMDVQMPGVDGLEAIQRIRQIPEHKETLIIALTGLAMKNDADRCLAAGADHYLSKPYGMQKLVDLIRRELATRGRSSTKRASEAAPKDR